MMPGIHSARIFKSPRYETPQSSPTPSRSLPLSIIKARRYQDRFRRPVTDVAYYKCCAAAPAGRESQLIQLVLAHSVADGI